MKKQPSSRTCFLCGRQNDIGLKISWYSDIEAGRVRAKVVIPEQFNGYPGFVHGGIVAALLDETSGRATMLDGDNDNLMVTTRLEVKYLLPTPTDQELFLVGWQIKGNKKHAHVAAELQMDDGTVTAICKATVVKPPSQYYELWKWESEKEHWRIYDD